MLELYSFWTKTVVDNFILSSILHGCPSKLVGGFDKSLYLESEKSIYFHSWITIHFIRRRRNSLWRGTFLVLENKYTKEILKQKMESMLGRLLEKTLDKSMIGFRGGSIPVIGSRGGNENIQII
jgi:hypothetical protein